MIPQVLLQSDMNRNMSCRLSELDSKLAAEVRQPRTTVSSRSPPILRFHGCTGHYLRQGDLLIVVATISLIHGPLSARVRLCGTRFTGHFSRKELCIVTKGVAIKRACRLFYQMKTPGSLFSHKVAN